MVMIFFNGFILRYWIHHSLAQSMMPRWVSIVVAALFAAAARRMWHSDGLPQDLFPRHWVLQCVGVRGYRIWHGMLAALRGYCGCTQRRGSGTWKGLNQANVGTPSVNRSCRPPRSADKKRGNQVHWGGLWGAFKSTVQISQYMQ